MMRLSICLFVVALPTIASSQTIPPPGWQPPTGIYHEPPPDFRDYPADVPDDVWADAWLNCATAEYEMAYFAQLLGETRAQQIEATRFYEAAKHVVESTGSEDQFADELTDASNLLIEADTMLNKLTGFVASGQQWVADAWAAFDAEDFDEVFEPSDKAIRRGSTGQEFVFLTDVLFEGSIWLCWLIWDAFA